MNDSRPGLAAPRLARLVREAVDRCRLDLSGTVVLTEAATGPYVVTPVIAALAGAQVIAVTAPTRYGTVDQVTRATLELAGSLGVAQRISVAEHRSAELFGRADIITNSGHVRPIVDEFAAAVRSDAVIPLMFESWEIEAGRLDIELNGLLRKGVQIAGTNERHPHVDVFSFLGPMAFAQLADAGISAYRGRIALLCDNPFEEFLVGGLKGAGADVLASTDIAELFDGPTPDALVVALRPTGRPVPLNAGDLAARWPAVPVLQFWGDIDRAALAVAQVPYWPIEAPGAGHMGVLPSRVGPEPIVRLQAGGLKVAQVLRLPAAARTTDDLNYVDELLIGNR